MKTLVEKRLTDPSYYDNDYTSKIIESESIFYKIYEVCGNQFNKPCGSYLFNGQTYSYYLGMYPKQKLLYDVAKNASSVLEIGTYMGHSILIMLLANPNLDITCIDIDSTYAGPATDLLKTIFPSAKINFICGDSLEVLPTIRKEFDLFHIDGHHSNDHIKKEFDLCQKLVNGKIMNVIFDDVGCCRELENVIQNTYDVIKQITPGCDWTNTYFEIQIEVEKQLTIRKLSRGIQQINLAETKYGSICIINYATFDYLNQYRQQKNTKWCKEWANEALNISNKNINSVDIVNFGPDCLDIEFCDYNKSILHSKVGAGYWLWKPYIITSMLLSTNAEFLVYCDSGSSIKVPLENIVKILQDFNSDILVFELGNSPEFVWTKGQVLREMGANEPIFSESQQIAATASIWRVSDFSRNLAQEWLYLMQNSVFSTDLPSNDGKGDFPNFIEHRRDQSVFSILIKKSMISQSSEHPLIVKKDFETYIHHHRFG
jgi:Methyltransferase domain